MHANDPVIGKMKEAAQTASRKAYCPYSKFPVGAAVLTEDGTVFSGCNVENASFGLTMCAERNAVFHAVTNGYRKILSVVIFTPADDPTPPCGACRQVIYEFGPHAEVFSFGKVGDLLQLRLDQLLPEAFGPKSLPS
jgi:cytidine deaminase